MKLKIFCHCSLFPSWSGYGLSSTPVPQRHWLLGYTFLGLSQAVSLLRRINNYVRHSTEGWVWIGRKWSRIISRCYTSICL